jgi:hypothetical protein
LSFISARAHRRRERAGRRRSASQFPGASKRLPLPDLARTHRRRASDSLNLPASAWDIWQLRVRTENHSLNCGQVILAAAAAIARADLLRVKQDDAPARWIQLPHLLRQRMILLRSGINSLHRRLTSGSQARRPMFPDLGQWREWERASENIRESSEVSLHWLY